MNNLSQTIPPRVQTQNTNSLVAVTVSPPKSVTASINHNLLYTLLDVALIIVVGVFWLFYKRKNRNNSAPSLSSADNKKPVFIIIAVYSLLVLAGGFLLPHGLGLGEVINAMIVFIGLSALTFIYGLLVLAFYRGQIRQIEIAFIAGIVVNIAFPIIRGGAYVSNLGWEGFVSNILSIPISEFPVFISLMLMYLIGIIIEIFNPSRIIGRTILLLKITTLLIISLAVYNGVAYFRTKAVSDCATAYYHKVQTDRSKVWADMPPCDY